jgi:hypothetical protein
LSSALIFNKRRFLLIIFLISALIKIHAAQNNPSGLANISIRDQNPSCRWAASADFLAWFASEETSSIWADVISVGNNTSTWAAKGFNFKWDYGFRLGVGYDLVYDQWDTLITWTWFRTDVKHQIPFEPDASISPEFFAAYLSGDTPQSMSARWDLLLNMFDWELGRSCWISKNLSLRPFLGIKGGWINQSIHAKYYNLTIKDVLTHNSGNEHLKNNFWGIGPLGGINSLWKVRNFGSHFLDFFGNFSIASMWGTWHCSDVYKNTVSQTSSVNTKNSTLGALMFRGFMGIGWDIDFNASKSHFSTKLGYEMQLWVNQLRFATFQVQRLHGDLTLQGITFNCRFDF